MIYNHKRKFKNKNIIFGSKSNNNFKNYENGMPIPTMACHFCVLGTLLLRDEKDKVERNFQAIWTSNIFCHFFLDKLNQL